MPKFRRNKSVPPIYTPLANDPQGHFNSASRMCLGLNRFRFPNCELIYRRWIAISWRPLSVKINIIISILNIRKSFLIVRSFVNISKPQYLLFGDIPKIILLNIVFQNEIWTFTNDLLIFILNQIYKYFSMILEHS